MTSPVPAVSWEEGLVQVLDAKAFDRRTFVDRPWISLVQARNIGYAGIEKFRFDDIPPNQFRFVQRLGPQDDFGDYPIRIVEGRIDWFVGAKDDSPHEHFWNGFHNSARDALNQIPDSSPLSPRSFHTAAESMYNLAMWLDQATGELQAEINNLDGGSSGFEGAAAHAFRESLLSMRRDMLALRQDLESSRNWPQMLHENGDRAEWFWRDMRASWSNWIGNTGNQPNGMISQALTQIRNHVVGGDPFTDNGGNWNISIDVGGGPKSYDFSQDNAFEQLNMEMHAVFQTRIAELDRWATIHVGNIRGSFEDTASNLLDPKVAPPPTPNGNVPPPNVGGGGGGGDLGLGDGGGGGGGDLGLGDGGGGGGGDLGLGDGGGGGGGDLGLGDGGGGGGGDLGLRDGSGGSGGGDLGLGDGSGGGGGDLGLGAGAGGGSGDLELEAGGGGLGPGIGGGAAPPPAGGFGGGDLGSGSGAEIGLVGAGGSAGGSGGVIGGGFGIMPGLGGLALPGGGGPGKDPEKPGNGLPGAIGGDFGETPSTIDPDGLPGSAGSVPGAAGGSPGSQDTPPGFAGGVGIGELPVLPGAGAGAGGVVGGGAGIGDLPGLPGGAPGPGGDFSGGAPAGDDFGEGWPGGSWQSGGSSAVPGGGMQVGALGPAPMPADGGGGASTGGGGWDAEPGAGPAMSGLVAGAAGGVLAAGAAGAAGPMAGGSPGFMPPMMGGMGGGAGGGGQQEKDRERRTWLAEDEEVWGTDPGVTPSVIGRDDTADELEDDRAYPAVPHRPDSPREPARGTGRKSGRAY
ncbi:WXG100 family type VII secretion target [Paractinoplanes hotanensis]|uniref:Uncharacterized protein n=1 Tax=Paractinoplanes hotanensis TaxID=2906497 RepID=A0ABT0YFE2_9ACTN|nr:hypothetical protein [Actinoplanes hotanensis]MCM4084242.1 hypothetical protein [Actinoplanes hotanensis]